MRELVELIEFRWGYVIVVRRDDRWDDHVGGGDSAGLA